MTETVSDSVGVIPDEAALRERIRQKVESAGTSFYWAMRLLPQDRRNGMYAVYAFCREVDDIADDIASSPAHKKAALAAWHEEIDALRPSLCQTVFDMKGRWILFDLIENRRLESGIPQRGQRPLASWMVTTLSSAKPISCLISYPISR